VYNASENFLFDSITALSLMVAFYYALTGFACAIYHRRELTESVKNFFFIGVGPVVGASILGYLFVRGLIEFNKVENSYTGNEIFGFAIPVAMTLGLLILGTILMVVWRLSGHQRFFGRRRETVDPEVAAGLKPGVAAVPEEAV
jgi:hypothetical protein